MQHSTFPQNMDYKSQLIWLIKLRWCAISLQIALVVLGVYFFNLTLPTTALTISLSALVLSNWILNVWISRSEKVSINPIGWILTLDTVALTILLYLSGGPANPFSIVYVSHVSIAAILLGTRWTWFMVGLTTLCFSFLFKFHVVVAELESHQHHGQDVFSAHLYGMLIAFLLVSIMLGYFLSKLAETVRFQEKKINELKAQQEKLSALTTLSAGAAHELGTPLGTIALIASELNTQIRFLEVPSSIAQDMSLISQEVDRCKDIIHKMSGKAGSISGETFKNIDVQGIKNFVFLELENKFHDNVRFEINKNFFCLVPPKSLAQSLITLINNALDISNHAKSVIIKSALVDDWIYFTVQDDGKGMTKEVLQNLGNPFFTTKDPGKGLGLGVFLVKLFASTLDGMLEFSSSPGKGTTAILKFPKRVSFV